VPNISTIKKTLGLSTLMAVLLASTLVACQKPTDIAGAPASGVTVGTQVDDTVMSTKVSAALLEHPDIKSYDIKVEVRKAEVMLSGFVDNQAQIDQAIALAYEVKGVKAVNNKLTIKASPSSIGNQIDDSVLTTKIKTALLGDVTIKSFDIAVVTNKGEVQLSGFVENATQITRATELVSKIEGVQNVVNKMSIKK
jgi:hyperosmotically inducible protein